MHNALDVSCVQFTRAPAGLRATGLLGWVSVVINGALTLDGLALRRTRDGRTVLSFPEHRGPRGHVWTAVRPTGMDARRAIEAQVLNALKPTELAS